LLKIQNGLFIIGNYRFCCTVFIDVLRFFYFLPKLLHITSSLPFLQKYLLGFSLTFATTVGWLFAFDREILELSLALLILASIFIYITVGVAHKVVYDNASKLEKDNKGQRNF